MDVQPRTVSRTRVTGHDVLPLVDGWTVASASTGPLPATVPGTVAGALAAAGLWRHGDPRDLDAEDWTFETRFTAAPAAAGEELALCLGGIATVAAVTLNGTTVLESRSMFARHEVDVTALLQEENELSIRCRALRPLLAERRRPRARWRTRLVADGNLRFFRTMLLGRMPGVAPGPAAVGPWRPVSLERRRGLLLEELSLRPRLAAEGGVLHVRARLRPLGQELPGEVEVEVEGPGASERLALPLDEGLVDGELTLPGVAPWWPHTHGEPALYDVRLLVGEVSVAAGRVGFRRLRSRGEVEDDGLDLEVNGVPVWARGAVWTPPDLVGLAPGEPELRLTLERARDAGMNMIRVPGTAAYESARFHELCDELGLLVWQDLMYANLDYPFADGEFAAAAEAEARDVLARLAGSPSLAVVCGNSEIEQQVAMLGLDPAVGRGDFFHERLPALLREAGVEAAYVPSAPCGGTLPFRPGAGVANYYGVGAYLRPLEDARRSEVGFAAECLAFANVPDETAVAAVLPEAPAGAVVHHPRWKAGVPRDNGAGWDFEDVRDHYLRLLFGVDPVELRRVDHERYLELSRAVSGEVMSATLGEWRRAASPNHGALVLWLRDLVPGAGWGVLDHSGEPKPCWHHLRRALAPRAVWLTDEGLDGVHVHVANDTAEPLRAQLRIALYRDGEQRVEEAATDLQLPGHGAEELDVEALLGRFVDAAWAYRFGPPGHDAIIASLESGATLLSQSVLFPAGRPLRPESPDELGLTAWASPETGGGLALGVRSERLAHGVRVHAPGFRAGEDAFTLEPGRGRTILLSPTGPLGAEPPEVTLTALNLAGRVRADAGERRP